MSTETLPLEAEAQVEITTADGRVSAARVEDIAGHRLKLTGADVAEADAGAPLTLRWPAGTRGRFALPATVAAVTDDQLIVEVQGSPTIEQHRRFVRGGGGENVLLRCAQSIAAPEFAGHVADVSECSFRARFTDLSVAENDPVWARLELGEQIIEVDGTIMTARELPDISKIELVVIFNVGEEVAQLIRQYVLRLQLLARARTANC